MIGKIIKNLRKESNYSQEDLSEITKIGRTTISDYERNKSQPTFETIEQIAKACNYEIYFRNIKTGEILTSKNILRKEL